MNAKTLVAAALIFFQCSFLCADEVRMGTTFSPIQSKYLDMDWKNTCIAALDLGFDIIRLGAYWSAIEKEEDVYDFSVLDWQVKEARQKKIPVALVVGMKAPRWPEYFIPGWVLERTDLPYGSDLSRNSYLRERTLKFIEKVINHYKDEPIVRYWQVENEPLDRIGDRHWFVGGSLLEEEVALVRRLDVKNRPVVLTVATFPNKFLRFTAMLFVQHGSLKKCSELADIVGLNVYPTVGHSSGRKKYYFRTTRKERERYFSELIAYVRERGKKVWITELQSEPWEPGHLVYKEKDKPLTITPGEAKECFMELRGLDVEAFFFWGVEYWLFRQIRYGDTEWIKMFSGLKVAERDTNRL